MFATLFICSSRGLIEFAVSKPIAYTIQLASLAYFLILAIRTIKIPTVYANTYFALIILALTSTLTTLFSPPVSILSMASVACVNFLNISFLFVACMLVERSNRTIINPNQVIIGTRILSLWIVSFSYFQYIGMIEFPGSYGFLENTRLSGAFGSMQHLSIVISILSLIALSFFIKSKKAIDAAIFILLISVLIISYTRIGYLIFGLSLACYLIKTSLTARRGALYKSVVPVVFGSVILIAIAGLFFDGIVSSFLERVNGINFEEASNKERMIHWEMGLAQFISGPILIGSHTGIASQIPKIIFGEPSFHYESGNLQYLVNFGALFWLITLSIFLKWSTLIPKESPLKHLPVVLTLALFIYMFNEIAPVYITFVLASICTIAIYHDKQNPSKEN